MTHGSKSIYFHYDQWLQVALLFKQKCISISSSQKPVRSLHAEQRTPGLSILLQGPKFKRLGFSLQSFLLPRSYEKVVTSPFPETSRMAYGTQFICKQGQETMFWEGSAGTESVFAFTKELWLCVGTCELLLLKNEAAHNWVMDHNTLKNCGASGWWAVHETLIVSAAISQLIHLEEEVALAWNQYPEWGKQREACYSSRTLY